MSSARACSSRRWCASRTRRTSCASSTRSSRRSAGASTRRSRCATRACSTARASTSRCGRSRSTGRWCRSASSPRSRSTCRSSSTSGALRPPMAELLAAAVQGARHDDHLGRHRLRQDHHAQRAVGLHLRQGAPGHDRGRGRAATAAAARRPHGDAAAQHRRQGRNPPARAGQERAAHAARPHHPRRVPRRGGLRHAAGDEHRPRRLDGDGPRQHPARRHLAPRADDRHGRPADDGRARSAARSARPSA